MRWTLAILGCLALTGTAVYLGAWWSPTGDEIPATSRMLYLHVPIAVHALLAFTIAAAAGAVYLWRRSELADRWARAAAGATLILGTAMLASGMVWARIAWNHWWDFKSPRLILSLLLWILAAGYVLLRHSLPDDERRRRVAAAYCIIAWADVPLVFLATRLAEWDIHPGAVSDLKSAPPGLGIALTVAFAAATALHGLILAANLRHLRRRDKLDGAAREA